MKAIKQTVHVVSHTHWDREWYMPYEAHHIRLADTVNTLLDTFDRDPEFRSFYLDGQTIVFEDYLQVHPEKREQLHRLSREGKLAAGPWYVLQDEFLTSSEANIRNLQIGLRDAREIGTVSKLGYFPDSFGNMGQAAQILRQAGIETAVFGRGVKATGFNNQVGEAGHLESPFSELIWESPDGSEVLGILFANWYNNGMEIPAEREAAAAYWPPRLEAAARYASTPHLLLLNGCDHQPVQRDLSAALRTARELYPDIEFIHSDYDTYIRSVRAALPDKLSRIRGELRGQRTDGWYSLVNTASARVWIKQLNQEAQTLLERTAEPLAAIAHLLGSPYPHALMRYAWKTLMQNHPHDSICGCSVDEVYREMKTRFAKSMEVGRGLARVSADAIAARIDTSIFAVYGGQAVPFAVFNTSGYGTARTVTLEIEWSRRYFRQNEQPAEVAEEVRRRTHAAGKLVDARGMEIAAEVTDLGVRFGYDLPDDKFRQPYMARALRLTFEAAALPGIGYRCFAWIPAGEAESPARNQAAAALETAAVTARIGGEPGGLAVAPGTLENAFLRVSAAADGSLTLLDKTTGQTYSGLGVYEDTGDIGNEYIYFQPINDQPLTTAGSAAAVTLVEDTPWRATLEIKQRLWIPEAADERLAHEVNAMVPFNERLAGRSARSIPLDLVTRVSLEREGKGVKVHARFDNASRDHRLRVLFPAGVDSTVHYADSVFEVAQRMTTPAPEWKNPSYCHHMQSFVDVHGDNRGLVVAGKGLNEYEILQDGNGTIAVTLLRAVSELGDWGVFPTPEAQCLGPCEAEWMILPHGGASARFAAYREAYAFAVPVLTAETGLHSGELPPEASFLDWSGDGLAFSSFKIAEDSGDPVARWYNLGAEETALILPAEARAYATGILEERTSKTAGEQLSVPGYAIVTAGLPGLLRS
ncbi:alpha-mannosidase [Paenibacillus sp. NFR01]|uniref:alpha-mannosidase n=1 Tax=Paenibacillus sp. NFR01 TaxID=1566279 RepID=UPI0008BEEFAB|nr:alpha-mannosidase [Paenibacillus sp. NFR01]SEU19146.1 alpha-mannosidase [Paenibacillus sp. NFR01]